MHLTNRRINAPLKFKRNHPSPQFRKGKRYGPCQVAGAVTVATRGTVLSFLLTNDVWAHWDDVAAPAAGAAEMQHSIEQLPNQVISMVVAQVGGKFGGLLARV